MIRIKITIKEVAKLAGVSVGTVSRIINNKNEGYSKQTYDKVMEVIEKYNFKPNQYAKLLTSCETKTIGLIIPDVSNIFFAEMSKSIEEKAVEYGYTVIFGNTGDDAKQEIKYMQTFINKGVDGIICAKAYQADYSDTANIKEIIDKSGIPFVYVDRVQEGAPIKPLLLDHEAGSYMATRHLIELGHTRIGCFTGPSKLSTTIERLEGYKKALSEVDIEYDPNLIFEGNFRMESGYAALPFFLNRKVTAIFCFNDLMAIGLYKNRAMYNVSVPKDISIIGFDDIPMADCLDVPLTTISQPNMQMGRDAVEQLIMLINGTLINNDPIIYKPKLIIRNSTGPVNFQNSML